MGEYDARITVRVSRVALKTDARGKPFAEVAARLTNGNWARIIAFGSLVDVAANLRRGEWIFACGAVVDTVARGQHVHEMVAQLLAPVGDYERPTHDEPDDALVSELVVRLLREKRRGVFLEDIAERYGLKVADAVIDEADRRGELQ